MAAAATAGTAGTEHTSFDVMAERITRASNIHREMASSRVATKYAYIAQVLSNCLVQLGGIGDVSVPAMMTETLGSEVINWLVANGYLNNYEIPLARGADAGAPAAGASSSSSSSSSSSGAMPVVRDASVTAREEAKKRGEFVSTNKLDNYRGTTFYLLQDILRSVHPDQGGANLSYNAALGFPQQSKYMVSNFIGDIHSLMVDRERVYARESAMVLIIHILHHMGYVGLPGPTSGTTEYLTSFFKTKAFGFAVGMICMTTPHIVSYFWGLPLPTLSAIYEAIASIAASDSMRFLIGSAGYTLYVNADSMGNAISYAYRSVFGGIVRIDPEDVPRIIAVGDVAHAPDPRRMSLAQRNRLEGYKISYPGITEQTKVTIQAALDADLPITRAREDSLETAARDGSNITARKTRKNKKYSKRRYSKSRVRKQKKKRIKKD